MDAFEVGNETMQMSCKHVYHENCIVPWLKLHNSCTMYRYKLPTDDPDHVSLDIRAADASVGRSGGTRLASAAGEEERRSSGRKAMQRRVRISLSRSLRGFGSHAQRSDNGEDTNDSYNNSSLDEDF
ncbi:E3 ubiquitin-protein ligase RING1-like [Phalaenopsis equestris]|uniref:E3 ubiquitin-protein ligase RING1-like n=1 Tax=Phalaenopsis equestris TaxID=78828 RepID=UPI0009E2E4D5|nr:E3 ubiquitin-protein ligase RING1-like [Phalaenopsis equestris]